MSVASRIMAERTRLIQNADEAFIKKLEGMLCKTKQKQSYGGTPILVLLVLVGLTVLFVFLIALLLLAVVEKTSGSVVMEYHYLPELPNSKLSPINPITNNLPTPTNSVTTINNTIIQPVQEVIKERVMIGQQKPCLKISTEKEVTYVCETI